MGTALKQQANGPYCQIAINDVSNALLVINYDGYIADANDKFCKFTGYPLNEMVGKHLSSFLPRGKNKLVDNLTKQNGDRRQSFELRFQTKFGSEIYFNITIMPAQYSSGMSNKIIMLLIDITHYKQMQRDLMGKEKQLELITNNLKEVRTQIELVIEDEEKQKVEYDKFMTYKQSRNCNLTRSEMTIAGMIRSGKTTKEIAQILCLSERTVSNHRQNIRCKMGMVKKRQVGR